MPAVLLSLINSVGNIGAVHQVSQALQLLPQAAQRSVPHHADAGTKVSYVLAVFLLAPIAVVVPLTISTAVGSATIVGERERGTGEFLAHSPAGVREIYLGKLIASLIPGYLTTVVGFGLYSLIVNLIVGPDVGGWFFPTPSWWLLILWVLPPFLAHRAVAGAAPVGPGQEHGGRPAGGRSHHPPADPHRLRAVHRRPLRRARPC